MGVAGVAGVLGVAGNPGGGNDLDGPALIRRGRVGTVLEVGRSADTMRTPSGARNRGQRVARWSGERARPAEQREKIVPLDGERDA
jgi:hypothetical protein